MPTVQNTDSILNLPNATSVLNVKTLLNVPKMTNNDLSVPNTT